MRCREKIPAAEQVPAGSAVDVAQAMPREGCRCGMPRAAVLASHSSLLAPGPSLQVLWRLEMSDSGLSGTSWSCP